MGSRRTRGDIKRMREQWNNPQIIEEEEERQLHLDEINYIKKFLEL